MVCLSKRKIYDQNRQRKPPHFPDEALQWHEEDLKDSKEYCYLGDECDYRKWKSLREWINTQPSES